MLNEYIPDDVKLDDEFIMKFNLYDAYELRAEISYLLNELVELAALCKKHGMPIDGFIKQEINKL